MIKNATLIILLCAIGIVAVSYGLLHNNNLIFILGLLCGVVAYLLFRRRLKDSIHNEP